ncbi:MAG: glycosyltransferase family 4 protein [Candidatus Peribacteraceae bacterium]|nr:glycosyltransferase family 4 protein [Candidatus Peribacteraceae bacterium]
MRIAYCTNVRLPSERAHGHQVAEVTNALATLGHEVTILAPLRRNVVGADFWTYEGVLKTLKLQYIGRFDPIASPFLPGVLGLRWMNAVMRRGIRRLLLSASFDLAYTRSPSLLSTMIDTGVPTILELHQLPRFGRSAFTALCNRCALVVPLTQAMAGALRAWGVEPAKIMVEGDAVNLRKYASLPSKDIARQSFNLRTDRTVVGYVGRLKTLGMEKGVETMLRSIAKDKRFFAFIVGGPDTDCRQYRSLASSLGLGDHDVRFTGEIPASQVPSALVACDILAMPFPDLPHYRLHMSPLKMFEYMASGRPIVTSDLPTIRDVLSEETAVFCKPGDTDSVNQALAWIVDHPEETAARAARARSLVERYTWEERMKRIVERMRGKRG